jgi:hypothetical protein
VLVADHGVLHGQDLGHGQWLGVAELGDAGGSTTSLSVSAIGALLHRNVYTQRCAA